MERLAVFLFGLFGTRENVDNQVMDGRDNALEKFRGTPAASMRGGSKDSVPDQSRPKLGIVG